MYRHIDRTDPTRLSGIFGLHEDRGPAWRDDELEAIYRHQLAAPLYDDLVALDPQVDALLRSDDGPDSPGLITFRDLLHHRQPPTRLLELVKQFAKASRAGRPDAPLPERVATLLYYVAIAVALIRCQQRISDLDDAALRRGLDWALRHHWLDEHSQRVLRQASAQLPVAPARPIQ